MADLSKITLPSGTTYNFKDAAAREDIAALQSSVTGAMHYIGITSTALEDNATTNPIVIDDNNVTAEAGDVAIYGETEFVFNGTKWQEFGSTGSLKALAFKDNASGDYTPAGTVSTPTVTVTPGTTTVNSIDDVGTLPTCTLPVLTATVENENLTLGWAAGSFDAGTLPTKGADTTVLDEIVSAVASQPTFSGTQGSVTVS